MDGECLVNQTHQLGLATALMTNWQVFHPLELELGWRLAGLGIHLLQSTVFFVQVAAVGALLGLFVLYVANKAFDWGLFGRPVYLVDIFCFRPPER